MVDDQFVYINMVCLDVDSFLTRVRNVHAKGSFKKKKKKKRGGGTSNTPLSLVSSLPMLSVVYVDVHQLTNGKNGDVVVRRFLGLQSRLLRVP